MADMTTKILTVDLNADKAINGIINLNNAIEKNTSDIKANNAMIAENNKKMKENGADVMQLTAQNQRLAQSNVELEAKTKALKDERRVLQKETQNEIKMQTEEIGSLKALRAELSNATKEFDSLSRAERENGQRGRELKAQINSLTSEIKSAEQGTQRYYRNVGNYQNAILGSLGSVGRSMQTYLNFQRVFATEVTDDNQQIEESTSNMGSAFQSTMVTMNASLRVFGQTLKGLLTNPVFLAIAGIAGTAMAFKWFYDYNVGIEQALRLTREFTGVTGSELQNLRAEIQATASTYGKEYKEVLEAVDLLMTHFDLTSEQAMRTLNDGFMIGADINGNYLQLLKQYAPTLKDAGINAQQLVAYIQQTRSGIFSQQGLEAIKQASARIREMNKATRDSLQAIGIDVDDMQTKLRNNQIEMVDAIKMVSDKLKELPSNAQEVGNVMADVFGRQGKFSSQEMIKSLGDIETNLESLKEASGNYGKALDDNQKATADLEKATAEFFGVGENGWETLKTQADTFWKRTLTNTINKTKDLISKFAEMGRKSDIFRVVANTIGGVIWQLTGGIIGMFTNIGQGFKAIGSWIDAFVQTFKSAFGIIKDLGSGVADILSGNIEKGINEIRNGLDKGVTNALKSINTALKETTKAVNGTFKAFSTGYEAMDRIWGYDTPRTGGAQGSWGGSTQTEDTDLPLPPSPTSNSKKGNTKSTTSKATPKGNTQTAKKERDEELERQRKLYEDLLKQAKALEKKALDEQAKISVEGIDAKYKAQEEAIRSAYSNLNKLTADEQKQANEIMQKLIDANTKEWLDALAKRSEETKKAYAEQQKVANEKAKQLVDASLEASTEGTDIWLKWRLEQLRMAMEAELAMVGDNSELRNAIIAKYEKQATQIYQENAKAQMEIQAQKYNAISTIVGGLAQVLSEAGENQKEFVILQKTLATAEIMIAQAVAIANAIKDASQGSITVWDLVAKIATGVTAVTVAMMQAFNSLDSAKFAVGGYIQGAGTSTSDSIPIRVSNGESVMNANTTAMFGGLLSSLNQLGGGVPIQAQNTAKSVAGEDMLARAFAKGVAMLPNPVVSVQDINRGQRQVEVLNERALL